MKINQIYILLFLFAPMSSFSQYCDIGLLAGVSGYQGDINERLIFKLSTDKLTVGGFVRVAVTNSINVRANLIYSAVSGSDLDPRNEAWRIQRGFTFKSKIKEISGCVEWDMFSFGLFNQGYASRDQFTLYSFAGAGSALINYKTNFNESNFSNPGVALDKAAKNGPLYLMYHFGGGLKCHLTYTTTLAFEGGFRSANTDYLDGISKSANPQLKDWYFLGLVTLSQKIRWPFVKKIRGLTRNVSNSRVKCPDFKVNRKVY